MRVLDGEEITQADVKDLGFEGEGEVQAALNEAYVELMAFVNDRDRRRNDDVADRAMRQRLQACLDNIVAACDREAKAAP